MQSGNIWKRCCIVIPRHHWGERFDDYIEANMNLGADIKSVALQLSASVFSVRISSTGGQFLRSGSGTILDCVETRGEYVSTVVTSATLLGNDQNIEIIVGMSGHDQYKCEVSGFDRHYNVAFLILKSEKKVEAAATRNLSDFISVRPKPAENSWVLRPHSSFFELQPGVQVIALGRHHGVNKNLMAAPGVLSVDPAGFDCKELLRANCNITKAGIGGPLVNYQGEVIGLNFYDDLCTPFLPINVVFKCLEHFKEHGKFLRPYLGMELTNLHGASLSDLETILRTFPDVTGGVVIKKISYGGPADEAKLCAGDVITQFGGSTVRCSLELFTLTWSKVGVPVDVEILRKADDGTYTAMHVTIKVGEVDEDEFNSWPLPEPRRARVR